MESLSFFWSGVQYSETRLEDSSHFHAVLFRGVDVESSGVFQLSEVSDGISGCVLRLLDRFPPFRVQGLGFRV